MISSFFENTTCSPFYGPLSTDAAKRNATCSLGSLASYAINVTDAAAAVAGVNFARDHNIRLVVKNTGHDFLGRSAGQGSLALWTHHLKSYTFFEYKSQNYTGPAARIGAGAQVQEMYEHANKQGLRITGGSCPTVGAAGGWVQSGGHGSLAAKYGLGADNTLEFEVVTTDGKHLTASPSKNADLFWAISGGGPSNYAVVLSVTMKAHEDGPVAGSAITFVEKDPEKYWAAVEAWEKHLLVLDTIPGFKTSVTLTAGIFSLDFATLPDGSKEEVTTALAPFHRDLEKLSINATTKLTVHDTFLEHYLDYEAGIVYSRNVTVGNRLIPPDLVRSDTRLPQLTKIYKEILATPNTAIFIIAQNVTQARTGHIDGDNAVIKAWRESLHDLNYALINDPLATFDDLSADLALVNKWQYDLRDITPGGGNNMNEATYDYKFWKEDYYGETYARLAGIKEKYDPDSVLWIQPGAGNDKYALRGDGHLCKT